MKNPLFSKAAIWIMALLLMFTVFNYYGKVGQANESSYSELIAAVKSNQVESVEISDNPGTTTVIEARLKNGSKLTTTGSLLDRGLVQDLLDSNVSFKFKAMEEPSFLVRLLISWGPILILVGVWIFFMRQMQGGGKGGGAFSFGKSKARMLDDSKIGVTFADVAGCDEAKEEVAEVVDYLRDPNKYQRLGGRMPRGILMVGPPGTGKTLLAKSIAGEAKVPFFTISGSDFVEMFVGVGAARVRDMFETAKKNSPCIIFIDEIDAVGRHRGAGIGGGNDEREQTLNQMLVEMDGFETNQSVIVIAATNRPDILDTALLRPGRFDRQVYISLPDVRGREQILQVHMKKIPVDADVDAKVLARGTPGMSGADLANLCNEAALMASRRNARKVQMIDFEQAKDKIFMGPERKSAVIEEEELKNTAYHEAGHAIIGCLLEGCDPVHKVTIIPRGRALGVTFSLPAKDTANATQNKRQMLDKMSMAFGGRIAEEVFIGQTTTGACSDFEYATKLARAIVAQFGMTKALGPIVYVGESADGISEATREKIDDEVMRIVNEQYAIAQRIIEDNKEKMHAIVKALLEWETIYTEQLDDILAGREPTVPSSYTESSMPNRVRAAAAKLESEAKPAEIAEAKDDDQSQDS